MADAYLEMGRYQEADDAIATLERAAGNDQGVLARRAFSAEVRGRTANAAALLQRAIGLMERQAETGREIAWFHTRLGDLYFHNGCLSEAEQAFQSALSLSAGYPFGLVGLGDVRAIQGRLPDAVELYQKALAGTPVPRRLFVLAALEERLNRTAEAQRHRQEGEALAKNTDGHPPAHYRDLAQFYAEQLGRASDALAYAEKDLEVRQDVRAYDTLAWALYRNRRFQEAATAIGEAMKYGTQDPDFYYHAGMIHEALGEKSKAQAAFDRALQLRPRAPIRRPRRRNHVGCKADRSSAGSPHHVIRSTAVLRYAPPRHPRRDVCSFRATTRSVHAYALAKTFPDRSRSNLSVRRPDVGVRSRRSAFASGGSAALGGGGQRAAGGRGDGHSR